MEDMAEATIAAFAPLGLARPKLSLKLLSRPPFRFLHALISNAIKASGKLGNVHSETEQDADAIETKLDKMAYFEKLIATVAMCTGGPIDVRAAKIVAGLEPQCTNAFLQTFAKVVQDGGIDHEAATSAMKNGKQPGDAGMGGGGGGGGPKEAPPEAKAPAPEREPRPEPAQAMHDMLAKLELPQYQQSLQDGGYETLEDLSTATLSDLMDDINVKKPHAKRILESVSVALATTPRRPGAPPPSGSPPQRPSLAKAAPAKKTDSEKKTFAFGAFLSHYKQE
jgi:TRAF3-interacting protein 1